MTHAAGVHRGERAYHVGNVRNRLLDAAKTILEREGRDHLQLRAIAARIGVSAPTVYYHYADKRSLLAALAREGFAGLRGALEQVRTGPPGGEGLSRISAAYLGFVDAHPSLYRLMYEVRETEPEPGVVAAEEEAFEALRAAVARTLGPAAEGETAANVAEALWAFGRGAAAVGLARGRSNGGAALAWIQQALLGLALLNSGGLIETGAAWLSSGGA